MFELIDQMLDIGKEYIGAPECPPGAIFHELMFIFLFGVFFISTTVINFIIQRRKR